MDYNNSVSSNEVILKCKNSSAQWRNYWVKELEVGGLKKLQVKADLGLIDYSRFFDECSGEGVKYDNYVSLFVLSSNPKPTLDAQCNKLCSDDDWSKCSIDNAQVLASCGVPRCSEAEKCDFEVDVSGADKVYFVLQTSDAWLADIEGKLSNLNICGVSQ